MQRESKEANKKGGDRKLEAFLLGFDECTTLAKADIATLKKKSTTQQ
jgi:hypothetical protein